MDHAFQDSDSRDSVDQRPLLGVYPCLYCGRCFSIKRQLKLHYGKRHRENIPNYEGEKSVSVFNGSIRVQDTFERIVRFCSNIPSSSSQLIVLLIVVIAYYGS